MPSNEIQVARLIERLIEKTKAGTLAWQPSSQPNTYQSRFGDFVIRISGTSMGMLSSSEQLTVARLDGSVVERIGTGYATSATAIMELSEIPPEVQKQLSRLYRMVADKNDDLEELIRMLG